MANQPAKDLAEHIESNISSLTLGSQLFYGPIRAASDHVPKEAVFVTPGSGGVPRRDFGKDSHLLRPILIVVVRSGSWASGESLARDIHAVLQDASVSNYQDVFNEESEPGFEQFTDTSLIIWSWAVRMVYDKAS